MKKQALVVFSGGLDSILAVKLLQEQDFEVIGLAFDSYFFDSRQAEKSAKETGIDLIVVDISREQLKTVQDPRYGYGKALNPCIDCHGLMFKVAGSFGRIIKHNKVKYKLIQRGKKVIKVGDFTQTFSRALNIKADPVVIATGEVLGQRPMSQNKIALRQVEELAGIELLRPLSAKLLPATIYEKTGLVDRSRLLDISGRNRQQQLLLARKYNISYYPAPAGGCRLTEINFSQKLSRLLQYNQDRLLLKSDFQLLQVGKHYWLRFDLVKRQITIVHELNFQSLSSKKSSIKLSPEPRRKLNNRDLSFSEKGEMKQFILGRNKEENEQLEQLAESGDVLLRPKEVPGPTGLLRRGRKVMSKIGQPSALLEIMKQRMKSQYHEVEFEIKEVN